MTNDTKCWLGSHHYEIIEQKEIKNPYGAIVGTSIISRCINCGKIKETVIYTDVNYKRT